MGRRAQSAGARAEPWPSAPSCRIGVVEALQAGGMDDDTLLTLGRAMQHPAPLDLRVNTLKTRREDALAALQTAGISAEATPLSPFGLRVKGKPALTKMPLFTSGQIEVQDDRQPAAGPAAGRAGRNGGGFCAGAGGKTLLLGAMMASTGRLYAFDISEKRLANLKPRLARARAVQCASATVGLKKRQPHQAAGRQDRPRSGGRALLGPGHPAPQPST